MPILHCKCASNVYLCPCSDVHGDMSAIVLSLRWPATSLNQALERPMRTPPPKGKYRSAEQQAASERAQHRWGQIKMLHIEFLRARRCISSSFRELVLLRHTVVPLQLYQQSGPQISFM